MRLLKDEGLGKLSLVEHHDDTIPRYAILSHTWGADGEEVTFKDLTEGTGTDKAGYKKINFCREQAANDGLQHFWVDTCCIDKSSSAELTEAINSMFRWYQNSEKCYVYLSDVSISGHAINSQLSPTTWEAAFRKSRWFRRGWTLQELLAPASVEFFTEECNRLGSKRSLEGHIQDITGIPLKALCGEPLTDFEVEERFSWAKNRETKRQEDKVYSLLGIFDIQMPLLYGEGKEKALMRLRKKIDKSSKRKWDSYAGTMPLAQLGEAASSTIRKLPVPVEAGLESHLDEGDARRHPAIRIDLLQTQMTSQTNNSGNVVDANCTFDTALAQFVKTLPEAAQQHYLSHAKTPDEVVARARSVDESSGRSSGTRSFLTRAQDILVGVDQFLESAMKIIQHNSHISSLVVGGIRLTLSLGLKYNAYFELVSSSLETVTDHLTFLRTYAVKISPISSEVQTILVKTYIDMITLCVDIWSLFHQRDGQMRKAAFRVARRAIWNSVGLRVQRLQESFERRTELVVSQARVLMYSKDVEEMNLQREERLKNQRRRDAEAEVYRAEKRQKVLGWITNLDYTLVQYETLARRFKTSGSWLLDRKDFQDWLDSDQSAALWCYGNPGAGKTVLTSIVNDYLDKKYHGDSNIGLCRVFFSYKDDRRPEEYVLSLLRQLLTQLPRLPSGIEDRYDELWPEGKSLTPDDLDIPISSAAQSTSVKAWTYVLERFPRVVIVLDALDECENRHSWLMPMLGRLTDRYTQARSPFVKLFVSSRRQPDISRAFDSVPTISIEACNVTEDIREYVDHELSRRIASGELELEDHSLIQDISSSLTCKANGMFLWVKYQLDHICEQMSDRQIRLALQTLPDTLYAHYDRVLLLIERQSPNVRQVAKRTICWLAHAARQLHHRELAEAIAVNDKTAAWEDLDIIKNTDRIVHACHSLVAISPSGAIAFVHYSVQEYFLSTYLLESLLPSLREYHIAREEGHRLIASACLAYLGFIDTGFLTSALSKPFLTEIPSVGDFAPGEIVFGENLSQVGVLSHYAGMNLFYHLTPDVQENDQNIRRFDRIFASSLNRASEYVQTLDDSTLRARQMHQRLAGNSIEAAAKFGLESLLVALLQIYAPVSQDIRDRAAILASQSWSSGKIVNLLDVHLGITSPWVGPPKGRKQDLRTR